MKIKKVVIPVAGRGTRFLPATKEIPKEMLPILTRPMIHYIVEEVVNAGFEEVIFVTAEGKESLEAYFAPNTGLEEFLESKNKTSLLKLCKEVGSMIKVVTVKQDQQLGLGHAINCAKDLVGNETFGVLLGDDMIVSEVPVIKQLMQVSDLNEGASVIGVMEVENSETNKYGIIDGEKYGDNDRTLLMKEMIEKPEPSKAPSNLATPGRYILSARIFDYLEKIPKGVGGEYQLTDAINMLAQNEKVLAHRFEGERYDTGTLPGYLKATVDFAMKNPETQKFAKGILEDALKRWG